MTIEFTARNGSQLSAQIDRANAELARLGEEECTVNFGKARSGAKRWYVHGAYGADLKDLLSFDDLIREIQKRFALAFDWADARKAGFE